MTLAEKLWEGDMDLKEVLLRCGISCESCYLNNDKTMHGVSCDKENVFVSYPDEYVCMRWRQRKEE